MQVKCHRRTPYMCPEQVLQGVRSSLIRQWLISHQLASSQAFRQEWKILKKAKIEILLQVVACWHRGLQIRSNYTASLPSDYIKLLLLHGRHVTIPGQFCSVDIIPLHLHSPSSSSSFRTLGSDTSTHWYSLVCDFFCCLASSSVAFFYSFKIHVHLIIHCTALHVSCNLPLLPIVPPMVKLSETVAKEKINPKSHVILSV